tara:strand:- start:1435 stop:2847 length:1413 start_codon:yes stop_codon:yes gene_type:complete
MDIGTSSKYKKVNEDTLFYKAAWRWHFYAGIFVTPFMLILAVTGMIMMYIGYFDGRDGERVTVPIPPNAIMLTLQEQSNIALATHPKGKLVEWIKASEPNRVNVFRIKDSDGSQSMVAVNPYNGEIVNEWLRRQGWYDLADDIHSDLLLGTIGDRILEIAAGFAIILIITGVYLWWPKDRKIRDSLIPKLSLKGRLFWKEVHVSLGVYVSIFFFLFLLSGMSWTGVWGGKLVQAWSTFPAEKWDNIPLSDETHASLNYGPSGGMPWAIEETPLPASGSKLGVNGTLPNEAVNINSIERLAQRIGFEGRYRVSFPKGNTGVWTINQDTMNSDAKNPFADKTVHIDRYTGHVLSKVTFDDYSLAGKTMAVSIPIHMGLVTIWNLIINTIICLSVIVLSITGVIMWWKRRPEKSGFKLVPPSIPSKLPHWHNAMIVMLALSLFFPLVGITLVCVLLLDMFILSRIPILKKIFK